MKIPLIATMAFATLATTMADESKELKYTISCPAPLLKGDPLKPVTPSIEDIKLLNQYKYTGDCSADYIIDDALILQNLGITGGWYSLHYEKEHKTFFVKIEYTNETPLSKVQTDALLTYTKSDIGSGVGEGFYQHLKNALGVQVKLIPILAKLISK